jgi:hypothetical protein
MRRLEPRRFEGGAEEGRNHHGDTYQMLASLEIDQTCQSQASKLPRWLGLGWSGP